ncbi:MAG: hypothetical protein HKM88_01570, partial [Halobacteria archaeon]|nr:hypothetical protein [Halobacteria archaeon]
MKGYRLLAIPMLAAVIAACSTAENGEEENRTTGIAASSRATVLLYQEQEAGTDSYPLRILVSPEYLRIDDGYPESDFTLLDRTARTVFSVSHEDRSILVVPDTTADRQVPPGINMELEQEVDTDAPSVAG